MAIQLFAEIPLVNDARDLLVAHSSLIQQNADNILLRVAEADFTGENIVSQINIASNEIKIQSAHIALEGLTTINSKFKVLLDGTIEAVDGNFSGTITGSVIAGNTITGGTVTGSTVRTSSGNNRIQLTTSFLETYLSNVLRFRLSPSDMKFYDSSGVQQGALYGGIGLNIESDTSNNQTTSVRLTNFQGYIGYSSTTDQKTSKLSFNSSNAFLEHRNSNGSKNGALMIDDNKSELYFVDGSSIAGISFKNAGVIGITLNGSNYTVTRDSNGFLKAI